MEYTEEQKQEADSVACKYKYLYDVIHTEIDAIKCAIQDRQSVLEAMIKVAYLPCIVDAKLKVEIQSINAQIEYLKSKI